MASVLACVWQLHHLMLTLVDTPCPVLTQAGATDPPPRHSPTGGCLVPAPDGSLWPVGGSGPAGAAPHFCGCSSAGNLLQMRILWPRPRPLSPPVAGPDQCCDEPPRGRQELKSHMPPSGVAEGCQTGDAPACGTSARPRATRFPRRHSLSRGSCSHPTWPPAAQVSMPRLRTGARPCPESGGARCRGCGQGGEGAVLAAHSLQLSWV